MRLSSVAFGVLGAALVLAGVTSLLLGVPLPSRDIEPVAGLADLGTRLAQLSLPLSAAAGAVVTFAVSLMLAVRRLATRPAAFELLVLGVAIEVSLVAFSHRYGYASNGSVLLACVAALCGGIAIVVAAFAAAGVREER